MQYILFVVHTLVSEAWKRIRSLVVKYPPSKRMSRVRFPANACNVLENRRTNQSKDPSVNKIRMNLLRINVGGL